MIHSMLSPIDYATRREIQISTVRIGRACGLLPVEQLNRGGESDLWTFL